ncbi:MAG: hypothetical protein CL846_02605 [Crocinitomicaceae bacterium]|nr:hypothetical protein [Crocinitomicaceae bacterium]|tara:strand:+ start:5575 stop:7029 length:1455 start_codon:yes stop_codon:yes gene_type:complete
MLRLIAILIFCFQIQNFSAITIYGRAPSYKNKTIKWIKKSDYISNQFTTINKTKVDSKGNFELKGDFESSCLTELNIGMSAGLLYVDKNTKNYTIFFPEDSTTSESTLKKHFIQLIFQDLQSDDLNYLILDFNNQLDYFLFGDNEKLLRFAKQKPEFQDSLNDFKIKIGKKYQNFQIKFLHNYIRYEVGLIEQMVLENKGEKFKYYIYKNYLSQHQINYNNNAYMDFFNKFYDKPFRLPKSDIIEKVNFAINNLNSFEELSKALENSIYFQEKKLSELAIIKGLGNAFFSNEYDKNNVLSILEEIALNSMWDNHKKIAENMIFTIKKLLPNTFAPLFSLKNQYDSIINLKSLKGKYTYINFFSSWNSESLHDMEIINQLQKKYTFINFVSINLDDNINNYNDYIKNHNQYTWNICNYDNKIEIFENYSIDHLPTYVLINPNGTICQYPAYPPSPLYNNSSIDETFFDIDKKINKKETFKIGGKN